MLSPPVLLFKFLGVAQTHSLFEKSEAKTLLQKLTFLLN